MKTPITFYHAGCPVCIAAEQQIAEAMDTQRYEVEIVHLGENPARITEAESADVQSVPAMVIGGQPFHINFGAALSELK